MSFRDKLDDLTTDERRKISEVIQGGDDKSTAWIYEQPKKNSEDFLLGKSVKSLEELAEINRDEAEETPAQRLARLDMQAKFREDPLNLMRQHEFDKRSTLLQNTAKMKKLQRLLEQQRQKNRESKKKHKKHKSKSKSRFRKTSSSDSEDDAILDKFISLIQQADANEPDDEAKVIDVPQVDNSKQFQHKPQSRPHSNSKLRDRADLRMSPLHKRRHSPLSEEDTEKHINAPDRRSKHHNRRSKKEMEALRAQMAADAKDRDRERQERYHRHQTEKRQLEADELAKKSTHGASFLRGLSLAHVTSSSLEEGVHRKANSRQRGGMDENFLRR